MVQMTSIGAPAIALISLIVVGLAFSGALESVYTIVMSNDDYSHGSLLPVLAAYLIWIRKDQIVALLNRPTLDKKEPIRTGLGIILALVGAFFFLAWRFSELTFVGWFGFFSAFLAVVFFSLRSDLLKIVLGPLAILYMSYPLPASIMPRLFNPLQAMAARASEVTLRLLGVPVFVQGNIIEIPGMRLLVEEACSGLRSVFAMTTVALLVCMMYRMSMLAKVFLIALALSLAVILNTFRVVATGVMSHFYDPKAAEGFFHEFTGMLVFIVGLVVIYTIAGYLMKSEKVGS